MCPGAGASSRCAAAALFRSLSSQQGAPQATGRQPPPALYSLYSFTVQCAGRPGPGGDQGWSRLLFPIYGGNQDQDILRPVADVWWPKTLHITFAHAGLHSFMSRSKRKVKSCLFPSTSRNASAYNQRDWISLILSSLACKLVTVDQHQKCLFQEVVFAVFLTFLLFTNSINKTKRLIYSCGQNTEIQKGWCYSLEYNISNGQLSDVTGSAHVMGRYLANAIVSDKSKWRK